MKEIGWPAPNGYTIFCDDIRQEIGNKPSFMGAYMGKILIPGPFPTALPKFVCMVHYFERPDQLEKPLELRIFFPGDADDAPSFRSSVPLPEASNLDLNNLGDDPRAAFIMPIIFAPFVIPSPGALLVRMARGDDEVVRLGRLQFEIGPAAAIVPVVAPRQGGPATKLDDNSSSSGS